MAVSEWVSVVSSVLSGVVSGSGGAAVTLLVARRQQDTARKLAQEERDQRRMEGAYERLLKWTSYIRGRSMHPAANSAKEVELLSERWQADPDEPKPEAFDRALWSDEVAEKVAELENVIRQITVLLILGSNEKPTKLIDRLSGYRERIDHSVNAIEQAVRDDLRCRTAIVDGPNTRT